MSRTTRGIHLCLVGLLVGLRLGSSLHRPIPPQRGGGASSDSFMAHKPYSDLPEKEMISMHMAPQNSYLELLCISGGTCSLSASSTAAKNLPAHPCSAPDVPHCSVATTNASKVILSVDHLDALRQSHQSILVSPATQWRSAERLAVGENGRFLQDSYTVGGVACHCVSSSFVQVPCFRKQCPSLH